MYLVTDRDRVQLFGDRYADATVRSYGEDVALLPFADAHIRLKGDLAHIKDHLDWQNRWTDGMCRRWWIGGDMIDLASPSNREAVRTGTYKSFQVEVEENVAMPTIERAYKLISPYVEKGDKGLYVKGHHLYHITRGEYAGMNTDEILAQWLGFEYCPMFSQLWSININKKGSKKYRLIHIFTTHGTGAGRTTNKLRKLMEGWDNLDGGLCAHRHQLEIATIPRKRMEGDKTKGRYAWLCAVGGFDSNYDLTRDPRAAEHYSETKLYPPNHVGGMFFVVSPATTGDVRISVVPSALG